MELIKYILTLSIGGTTIGLIVVYLGKFILNKSSELLIESHKNKLELTRIEHQIRFSSLHSERGDIIKLLYQDLYELEQKLVIMTSLFQGPEQTLTMLDKKSYLTEQCISYYKIQVTLSCT